ncbi:MAG: RNA helicase [Ignavibacteria bacterium RIFOXYB2_FULL_35_12]|nr:MAG: RNA helicase [Ignavibacteria bacterium GWA2_36_19]OGU50614.1 MAG: RNA helicase [Ignavibacteria bacterium GWC2_35_8]OGU61186.1 MAG: RNA helicase [Ignavibacteria bacterium GWF2_35_20]OGU81649.1 MAG: RNA helicase [Ignavibacteria bacterium RIFOXYA2_FULL_35_9]OGU83179.1 MAG: RNA helicase [Ignavibacteria bacterium RBG_16_35_7]OGU88692.1 MAG: RNA helicase [Ignavibacteria bacterium RIFOXYA12_FULL_35_25]OGU89178.1 MAG: RNA helicase [Ignavibacteria bacterium RIFOXYC12_FULL_35_11]OGU94387.1 MAG
MVNNGFNEFGFSEELLQAIKLKGFEEPTEIQRKIIPLILENKIDLVGQAQTGTGKTAAFALPIIEQLQVKAGHLQALVLVPTRELAIQVSEEFNSLRGHKNIHAAPIYGGQSYDTQFRHLKKGVDVIIGTPGRILDHLNRKSFSIDKISFAVLDEADEMLNMGFIEDIEDILSRTPAERRTLLFSATMPERIMTLAKKYMGKREIIRTKKSGQTTELTDQIYYEVKESDKLDALCRIIDTTQEFFGLVFCRTKNDVDFVSSKLADRDYDVEGLHGDITQNIREKILNKFRNKKINVLIATDVAARGLDIEELTHVINYALPQDAESYLHRIGRTGRAGKEGTAITFITPEEHRKLMYIKNFTQTDIRKQRIPKVKDVISFKREKIVAELKSLVEVNVSEEYLKIADDLLSSNVPPKIIAALIKNSYQNELEEKNYAEIRDLFESQKQNKDLRLTGNTQYQQRNKRQFERRGDRFSGKNRFESDRGKARMFLALGKKDDLTPHALLDLLKKKAKVPGEKVTGIHINDSYSFFNVTPNEADVILDKLNSKDKKKRPLVERAKPAK